MPSKDINLVKFTVTPRLQNDELQKLYSVIERAGNQKLCSSNNSPDETEVNVKIISENVDLDEMKQAALNQIKSFSKTFTVSSFEYLTV